MDSLLTTMMFGGASSNSNIKWVFMSGQNTSPNDSSWSYYAPSATKCFAVPSNTIFAVNLSFMDNVYAGFDGCSAPVTTYIANGYVYAVSYTKSTYNDEIHYYGKSSYAIYAFALSA